MKKFFTVAFAASIIFSINVFAQNKAFNNGFYAGVEVGASQLSDQSGVTAAALVNAVGGSAAVTQDKNIYFGRILGGYKITENFDVELGYEQSNDANMTFTGVSRTAVAYAGTVKLNVSGFDYSVLVRPSISSGMNGLFGRFGGHSLKANQTATLTSGVGSGATVASVSGSGYQFGFGYDAEISNGLDFRASYTRLQQVAGQSGSNANLFAIGILKRF